MKLNSILRLLAIALASLLLSNCVGPHDPLSDASKQSVHDWLALVPA